MKKAINILMVIFCAVCFVACGSGGSGSNVEPVQVDNYGLPFYATWFDFEKFVLLHKIEQTEKETFLQNLVDNYLHYEILAENETIVFVKIIGHFFNPFFDGFCHNDYEVLRENFQVIDCPFFSGENVTFENYDFDNMVFYFNQFTNGNDFDITNGNILTDNKIDLYIFGLTVNVWPGFQGCNN